MTRGAFPPLCAFPLTPLCAFPVAQVEHFLEEFWEMLAFFGNTLVFVISGIVIFSKLDLAAFDGRDVGLLILIYVVGTFLRGAIVGATYALLKTLGHKLEWRDSLVATWGGLTS